MSSIPPVEYYTSAFSGPEMDARFNMLGDTQQQALANLGAGVRPNLLDNPGLTINQRGQSSYNTLSASGYGVDRWWSIFANYDVETKTITSTSQQYGAVLRQPLGDPSRFAGKTMTLSVWVLAGSGAVGLVKATGVNAGLFSLGNMSINGPGLYTKTYSIPSDVGDAYPYFMVSASVPIGGSLQFATPLPFKLEFGDTQTLAYQDDDGNWQLLPQPDMDYGMQLMRCQRYFYRKHYLQYQTINLAYEDSEYAFVMIPLPVEMRTNPVMTQSAPILLGSAERVLNVVEVSGCLAKISLNYSALSNPKGAVYSYCTRQEGVTFTFSAEL